MTSEQERETVPHTCAGFIGAFTSMNGRPPTQQEVWGAAIRSWHDLNPPAQAGAGVVEALRAALRDMDAIHCSVENSASLVGFFVNRLNALSAAPHPAAPAGYVLAPVEPTREMLDAGASEAEDTRDIYRAMIAAAPTPPQPAAQPGEEAWRPIESAPRDESVILLGYTPHPRMEGSRRVYEGRWNKECF